MIKCPRPMCPPNKKSLMFRPIENGSIKRGGIIILLIPADAALERGVPYGQSVPWTMSPLEMAYLTDFLPSIRTVCPNVLGPIGQCTHCLREASSQGRLVQGTARQRYGSSKVRLVQGTARQRDASSKGRLVQGTARQRYRSSKGRLVQSKSGSSKVRLVKGTHGTFRSGTHRSGTR